MSPLAVHYVPVVTTVLAAIFSAEIFRRYREHPERLHLLWWALGVAVYGVGTFTEAATSIVGWNEPTFRAWYISGALLGGAPLAQGTVVEGCLECPWHGSRFWIDTGRLARGPALYDQPAYELREAEAGGYEVRRIPT